MAVDYSDYEFLKVDVAERIATVTINRPDSLNAVNAPMHHEFSFKTGRSMKNAQSVLAGLKMLAMAGVLLTCSLLPRTE